jgi:hypothetical protein
VGYVPTVPDAKVFVITRRDRSHLFYIDVLEIKPPLTKPILTYTEPGVVNALVGQKEALLNRINKAEDGDELGELLLVLFFAEPLWTAVGYGYKAAELKGIAKARATHLIAEEEHFLGGERANSKVRGITLTNITKLKSIVESLS